jgi:hypothetical protein
VKDIYSFAESETTSHKLPDKEEAQLYYANRPLSVKTETEIKSTILDSSSKFNNNNNEEEVEATANYSSDDEIEILDDEESTPKKDTLPKKTSNNNYSTKRKETSPRTNVKNISKNNSSTTKKEISPKTNSKNVSKNNSPKTNSKNVSKNNSSDSDSLLGQFDNLMERVLQSQIGNGQSPTGSGQKDRRETSIGQKDNGQTGSGQKKNLKRLSFESNKGGNENLKKSKFSPINKKATKTAFEDDSDIEEITLTDDDDDSLELNEESLSNLGNSTDLEIDDVKDQSVIEYDSPLLDSKVETDETLKNNNSKSKAKQLHFSDSQLDEEYDPIEINSNVVSRKSNNKTSPKNIRVIKQKDASSSSDDDDIIIEDDDHDDDFRKPTFKVKKIEKPSSLKNVLITPRTTKDEAKFAQSKITSTPIGGIERSISKTKIPAKSKPTSESSEDDIEVMANNSNDQVIDFKFVFHWNFDRSFAFLSFTMSLCYCEC